MNAAKPTAEMRRNAGVRTDPDRGRFVVGTGRCGTTLIYRILSTHPDCLGINETHWMPRVYAASQSEGQSGSREPNIYMDCVDSTFHVGGNPVFDTPDEIAERIRSSTHPMTAKDFCNTLLAAVTAYHDAVIWVDKTPDYCCHIPVLRSIWPDAKFLHVTRDPYWTALSMSKHPGYQALIEQQALDWCSLSNRRDIQSPRTPATDIEPYLNLWASRIEACRNDCADLPDSQYLELSFEHLMAQPKAVIRKLYDFFDLSANEDVVDAAAQLVNAGRVAKRLEETLPTDLAAETQARIKTYRQKSLSRKSSACDEH